VLEFVEVIIRNIVTFSPQIQQKWHFDDIIIMSTLHSDK